MNPFWGTEEEIFSPKRYFIHRDIEGTHAVDWQGRGRIKLLSEAKQLDYQVPSAWVDSDFEMVVADFVKEYFELHPTHHFPAYLKNIV